MLFGSSWKARDHRRIRAFPILEGDISGNHPAMSAPCNHPTCTGINPCCYLGDTRYDDQDAKFCQSLKLHRNSLSENKSGTSVVTHMSNCSSNRAHVGIESAKVGCNLKQKDAKHGFIHPPKVPAEEVPKSGIGKVTLGLPTRISIPPKLPQLIVDFSTEPDLTILSRLATQNGANHFAPWSHGHMV